MLLRPPWGEEVLYLLVKLLHIPAKYFYFRYYPVGSDDLFWDDDEFDDFSSDEEQVIIQRIGA